MSKVSSAVGGAPTNAAGSGSAGATSALRRIGDDPLLRPFLNSLFDPQAYVRTIIKDGKSEDCLTSINDCTEKINDEIQRFISQNKVSVVKLGTGALTPRISSLICLLLLGLSHEWYARYIEPGWSLSHAGRSLEGAADDRPAHETRGIVTDRIAMTVNS